MIRLVFALRRKPGMSLADFQCYWRETHGPIVAKSSVALKILRYVQLHTVEDPVNDQLAGARPVHIDGSQVAQANRAAVAHQRHHRDRGRGKARFGGGLDRPDLFCLSATRHCRA